MKYRTTSIKEIAEQLLWNKDSGEYKTCLLLGSGVSTSGGIPDTEGIIAHIKHKFPYHCEKIDSDNFHDYMGLLTKTQRREIIHYYEQAARVNIAHLYMALLVKSGYVDRIITTNFDPLIIKALFLNDLCPSIYDFSLIDHVVPGDTANPSVFYLHGRSDGFVLLDSKERREEHFERLESVFDSETCKRTWLVIGYNGFNDPVFKRLADIERFENRLYWIGNGNDEPAEHVKKKLLDHTQKEAYYLKGYDADKFFLQLSRELQLKAPALISRPFTYLLDTMNSLADYTIDNKTAGPSHEIKKWIGYSIRAFEKGEGFEFLMEDEKLYLKDDELIKLSKETWEFGLVENEGQLTKIIDSHSPPEARKYLAYYFFDRGVKLHEFAKIKDGDESEVLLSAAIEKYKKAIEIFPDTHEAFNNWGEALCELAQLDTDDDTEELYQEAIDKFKKALLLHPGYETAFFNIGSVLVNIGGLKPGGDRVDYYDKALEMFDKALAIERDDQCVYFKIGEVKVELADLQDGDERLLLLDDAIANFKKATEIKPDYHEAFINWGACLLDVAKLTSDTNAKPIIHEALEKFKISNKLKDNADYYNLACAYSLLHNKQKSMDYLKMHFKYNPETNIDTILADTDFDNLSDDKDFNNLIESFRQQ